MVLKAAIFSPLEFLCRQDTIGKLKQTREKTEQMRLKKG